MRYLFAILALFCAAPVAAQACPDSTLIIATGGAPHIVLYPDGSTYSTHSTESAAHRAAVNLSARLGEQVLVTRVAAWRVCSPGVRTDTTIVVPPPADTVVPPPAPPVDTVVTPPPPSTTPTQAAPNKPSHITLLTEHTFPGTITPSGWGYHQRSSEVRYVTDPTKPFGGQGAGEWVYTPGMGQGQNDPGAVGTSMASGLREMYVSFLVRHSPGFQEQTPGTKFCHFMMSSGQNLHLDKMNPTQPWGEMYGADAGQWSLAPTGWNGGIPHWDDSRTPRQGFNNVNAAAARVDYSGGWQTVELHLRYSSTPTTADGIVRMWVDGTLTAEYTDVRWPAGGFDSAPDCAGTYGGGSNTVTQEQWFRVGNIWVGR